MSLLEMSFCGTVLIIAIIIIRSIAINKLPKKTFIILWMIALLRLLVPYDIPSAYSIHNLFSEHINTAYEALDKDFAADDIIIPAAADLQPETLPQTSQNAGVPNMEIPAEAPVVADTSADTATAWPFIWMTGVLLFALYYTTTYTRRVWAFKSANYTTNAAVQDWLTNQRLRRQVRIKESGKITAPLTYGIFSPVILLPQNMEFDDELHMKYVLTHEFVHIKHFDTALKLTALTALCLHWFNPFVWIMVVLLNRDIELRCDECVISGLGAERKKSYAHMLINMAEKRVGLPSLMSSFSKNAATERIVAIMKFKKATAFTALTAALIIAGTGVAFATSADEIINTGSSAAVSAHIKTQTETGNPDLRSQNLPEAKNKVPQPPNSRRQPSNDLGKAPTYEAYVAKKAEQKARDEALDLQEAQLKSDYEAGKIDLETYIAKEAEIDRLDDELDREEDVLDFNYKSANSASLKNLNFNDYAVKKADIERREDGLDLQEDALEAEYYAGKIDLNTYKARQAELERADGQLDSEEDVLELMYGIGD